MAYYIVNWDKNKKTIKGQAWGYLTGILYLAPSTLSGRNVCPYASAGCIASCLNTSGHGRYQRAQSCRIEKTKRLFLDRTAFLAKIESEIRNALKRAAKRGFKVAIRLNGTSDLPVETWGLMEKFPQVAFYDYTKNPFRMDKYLRGLMPKNYTLSFSLSESNKPAALKVLERGGNVVVVFKTKDTTAFPATFWGYKVVNGDKNDLRFKDGENVVIALTMKGRAVNDKSGFVQDLPATEKLSLAA